MRNFFYRTQIQENGNFGVTDLVIRGIAKSKEVAITIHTDKKREIVLTSVEFEILREAMIKAISDEDLK